MPAPTGWNRRNERGLVGLLARWWARVRVRQIRKAQRRR